MTNPEANPWVGLLGPVRSCLTVDEHSLDEFDRQFSSKSQARIQTDALPEPYSGNVGDSRVLILAQSPSYRPEDVEWHEKKEFREVWLDNLLQRPSQFPFYPLNPKLKDSPVSVWWRQKLRELLSRYGDESVSKQIAVVQWFPYHMIRSQGREYFSRNPIPSQIFGFRLVADALKKSPEKAIIVFGGHPSYDAWRNSIHDFRATLEDAILLRNHQNFSVSPGNMNVDDDWQRVERLIALP